MISKNSSEGIRCEKCGKVCASGEVRCDDCKAIRKTSEVQVKTLAELANNGTE